VVIKKKSVKMILSVYLRKNCIAKPDKYGKIIYAVPECVFGSKIVMSNLLNNYLNDLKRIYSFTTCSKNVIKISNLFDNFFRVTLTHL